MAQVRALLRGAGFSPAGQNAFPPPAAAAAGRARATFRDLYGAEPEPFVAEAAAAAAGLEAEKTAALGRAGEVLRLAEGLPP